MEMMAQKTASTHRSVFHRHTHQFDIVGYSVRTALGISNSVRSCAFEAGGHIWGLVCCFEPRKLESICLELLSTSITRDVVAMASLRIDDPIPTGAGRWPTAAVWRSHEPHTFPACSSASSTTRTWRLSVPDAFKEARYVHDDRLTVHYTSRWPPDVTLVVEGAEIPAHKLVLSMRSPVFRAEFQGSMKERFTRSVRIDGMSASTFSAMLRFIYTDELPRKPKAVASQDPCTSKHMAKRRAAMAGRGQSIDATTVLPTMALVDGRYSCRQLEASCIEYLASGPDTFAAVLATPEYRQLRESSVSFVADIAEKVAMHMLACTCPSSSATTSSVRPKRSWSVCTAAAARGTHEFRIPNLSTVLMTKPDVGHSIYSGTFHVGGYDWRLHSRCRNPKSTYLCISNC
ncbi:BTB/POZ and MATH domain-containing protein 2-like [Panicum virgatum]|uniref:BTB/POZ and MATH domain-containing protein 2-like n=1 Tax=Panicum virgatum TaxID=38727 RepID=UPI0019D4F528|nr:BTB/POZ and MATH domain-containing protein 2-like [Panicum virgatum]